MKKIILFTLLAALLLAFSGCEFNIMEGETVSQFPTDEEGNPLQPSDAKISPEEAQKIAREALGITEEQMLSPFVHIGTYGDNNESCYAVMFATLERDYEFVISAVTGNILYRDDQQEATVTEEQALENAREEMGVDAEQMQNLEVEATEYGASKEACFIFRYTNSGKNYEVVVSAVSGEILYRGENNS